MAVIVQLDEGREGASFTIEQGRRAKLLRSEVVVNNAIESVARSAKAIWDTGASQSMISRRLVKRLGLVAAGRRRVYGPNAAAFHDTYRVELELPGGMEIGELEVLETDMLSPDIEVIIGMDVISRGTLIVACRDTSTELTFALS